MTFLSVCLLISGFSSYKFMNDSEIREKDLWVIQLSCAWTSFLLILWVLI